MYTSEIEAVTMMSGYTLLTGELTCAVFPPPKINPENPHEEFNFRVKRIRKCIISSGGHFFKCTDEDADRRIVAVTSWVEPSRKQWKDDPAQDPGTEEEALPSCIELSMHYAAIDATKGASERALKGNYNLWCKPPLIRMCFIDLSIDLGSLATDPDYQGKGIRRMVMQ